MTCRNASHAGSWYTENGKLNLPISLFVKVIKTLRIVGYMKIVLQITQHLAILGNNNGIL